MLRNEFARAQCRGLVAEINNNHLAKTSAGDGGTAQYIYTVSTFPTRSRVHRHSVFFVWNSCSKKVMAAVRDLYIIRTY